MVCIDVHEYERRAYKDYLVQSVQKAEKDIKKGRTIGVRSFEKKLRKL
ncbi:MAG: hypothetical protein IPJ69_14385 [Deltaproteobacteria bacterium]|nr:MAG: hypothetical protein IPJ69_14385 [Deltaproteobacteria bacterium]